MQDPLHFVLGDLKYYNISFWAIFSTAKRLWDPRPPSQKSGKNLTLPVMPNHAKPKASIWATFFFFANLCAKSEDNQLGISRKTIDQ